MEFTFQPEQHDLMPGTDFIPLQLIPCKRLSLPVKKDPKEKPSICEVIKNSFGKDLSRIAVPVQYNSPISFLQKFAEDFEYFELLEMAMNCPESDLRHAYVAAFIISGFSSANIRVDKPFNPLLGETFDFDLDPRFRCFLE